LAERKRHVGILNQRQFAFVLAHVGNDTEAARAAGYKNPERSAPKLMANPAIRKAIEQKQKATIAASGAQIAHQFTNINVVDRLSELAYLPPERTKNTITGQVSALKAIAEIQGHVVHRYEDLTKELADRTPEEKEFFAIHGYWKNEVEPN
jgi:phage terminase small subunit